MGRFRTIAYYAVHAPLCGQTKSIWQSMASEPQTKTSTLARKLDDKKKRIRLGKIFRSAASALLA
jgi:hypothetical protein